jgi:hypothetical protein
MECQRPDFIMFSKVHKIFALYSLNPSQLHKSYPPVDIKTGIDAEKWCFPEDQEQISRCSNHEIWHVWICWLIMREAIWLVYNTPKDGYVPYVSPTRRKLDASTSFVVIIGQNMSETHHDCCDQKYWNHTAHILLWGLKEDEICIWILVDFGCKS